MPKTIPDEQAGDETITFSSPSSAGVVGEIPVVQKARGPAATFTRNSAISVGRLLISTAVALVLPAYLTHKLPVQTYSAWVLILQMSAYVGYLDFGVQTGISKYVAEYEARGDAAGASMRASAGLLMMLVMSGLGVVLTLLLAWKVPEIFREMPPALYRDVRISLVLIGVSLSFGLLCSIFSAVFLGLQRYGVPIAISLINRFLFTGVVLLAVYRHSSLAVMGGLVAVVHVATGLLQIGAWRRMANHVRLRLTGIDRGVLKKMFVYCSALSVWTIGMLCVSGLDVTIVGRYDFAKTAFYSIATLPTNFMISIIGAALAPLLPTASALSVHRGSREMGEVLARTTRYGMILLIVSGLPLLVGGYWILRVWVGASYAAQTIGFLRILVLANVIRSVCLPYSSMLIATESQRVAVAGASAEAAVNVLSSIYLARHIGALGVAYGTLLGAFVSVGMHFAVSMRFTYPKFSISRMRLLLGGIARPLLIAVPSVLLLPLWWGVGPPAMSGGVWGVWAGSTCLLAWFAGLREEERRRLVGLAEGRLRGTADLE